MDGGGITINELIDRLWLPLSLAVVLLGGLGAYLIFRSRKLDDLEAKPAKTPREIEMLAITRQALRESRRILLRTAWRALLLVALLFAAVLLLNRIA